MIAQLSPFTRKLLALTILFLLLAGVINLLVVPLVGLVHDNVAHLADVRFERLRLETIEARPNPPPGDPVPQELYIHAADARAAAAQLSSLITAAAQGNGLTVEQSTESLPDPPNPRLVAAQIRLSGPEAGMMRFLNALEGGKPLVRLAQWTLAAPDAPGGPMQLDAEAVAAWGPAR